MDLILQQLALDAGIHFPEGARIAQPIELQNYEIACRNLAMDSAQPSLVTSPNAGIPVMLSTMIDPKVIEVMVAPMKAAVILGEEKKGDWITDTIMFPMIEYIGETSSYGDYNENGSSGANSNFPQRQSYHYQTMTQYGERELERAGLAKLDWASKLNIASILVLNKYQNLTYFFGVSGLQNYGLLNDPKLPPPIVPAPKTGGGITWANATAQEIYQDILNLFQQLQAQNQGNLQMDDKMTLALSPTMAVNLNKVSQYNVNVRTTLSQNFPNLRIETAPEYATASGQLMQMIVDEFEGQKTATAAFTEKIRAHTVVRKTSSYKQKKSQGTWGTVIFRPVMIGQMLGM